MDIVINDLSEANNRKDEAVKVPKRGDESPGIMRVIPMRGRLVRKMIPFPIDFCDKFIALKIDK